MSAQCLCGYFTSGLVFARVVSPHLVVILKHGYSNGEGSEVM